MRQRKRTASRLCVLWLTCAGAYGCVEGKHLRTSIDPPQSVLEASIQVSANGAQMTGVGVLPLSSMTKMKFSFRHPVKFLVLRTRHRQETFLFDDSKESHTWRYFPRTWIERHPGELSPVEVIAIDEEARETRALVVWHQENGLGANLGCNGDSRVVDGVSVCQSYQGLTQEIVFKERTRVKVGRHDCDVESMNGHGYRWHYKIAAGICVMKFTSELDSKKTHRHISRGYTDAITF